MFQLIQTKLLVAIFAALAVIASTEIYRAHEAHRAADAAAKSAAILEQQQHEAEARRKQDEAFHKQVEDARKHRSMAAGNESKTWKTYIP
jgi:hypothetical protein